MLRPPPALGSKRPGDLLSLLREAGRAAGLSKRDVHDFYRVMTQSVGDLLDDWFTDDLLKGAMASTGVVGVWAGPRTPGTAYNLLHHALGEIDGVPGLWGHVKGGMGAISMAIARSAEASGAEIRTGAEVESIDVRDGRTTGVTLADGETLTAPVVVSGAHPKTTVLEMAGAEHFPDEVVEDMRRYKTRGGSVKVNWVLSEPPRYENVASDEERALLLRSGVAFCPSIDYLERAWQDAVLGRPAASPYLEVEVPSTIDPTLTDDGTTVMTMFTQYGPHDEAGWPEGAREAYGARCLEMVAAQAPNVTDAVVHHEVLAPPDLERIFGLVGGSIFQGEQGLDQMAFMRPTPALAQYATPVDGLYLCGAGTHPGGGVMAAGGHNAAKRILHDQRWKRLRRRGREQRSDMRPPAEGGSGRDHGGGRARRRPRGGDDLTPAERARRFVEQELIPLEQRAEALGGVLPDGVVARIREESVAARLHGGLHAVEHGGQGWSKTEWFLVEEQYGRSTNALSWHIPTAYNVLASGTPEQIDRWLRPALRGELHDAYAVTEAHAGSDPSRITTSARRTGDGWVIEGEKWFVTYGTVAAVYIVVAVVEGSGPTLFLVPRETPGVEIVDDPPFTHTYPHGHPTIRFTGVEVGDDALIGGVGEGEALQRAWFTEERLGIAARGVGAMWRLLEESTAWALEREQGGARIMDHQGVSFPLADSAADAAAGRALGLEVARLADEGADPKVVHAKASMAKLFVSEAAYRCADRCVQVFGGRGYLRSNVAERFLRELRVDRIWEGTSEIQRLIVARALERRGVERTIH